MIYLIQTSRHSSPYIGALAFEAHDFLTWGSSVIGYSDDSEYLVEVRYREQQAKIARKWPSLSEVWAQEEVSRNEHDLTLDGLARDVLRLEKVSNMVRDFYKAIAAFGDENPPKPVTRWDSVVLYNKHVPLPKNLGLDLVTRYVRFSDAPFHTRDASLPTGSNSAILRADKVTLTFWSFRPTKWEQLIGALMAVASKPRRCVEGPERVKGADRIKVRLWVDVVDCAEAESGEEAVAMDSPPPYPSVGTDEPSA
jgi:hypothetical protein